MKLMPMPLCPGTVIVHRDQAMTCTSGRCASQLTPAEWFKIHSSFVPCTVAHRHGGCPDCAFTTKVVDLARRRRARHQQHPSAQPAGDDEWATVIPLGRVARSAH